jgi:hypothetical protein
LVSAGARKMSGGNKNQHQSPGTETNIAAPRTHGTVAIQREQS